MNKTFNTALAVILLGAIFQSPGCLTRTSGDKAGPVSIIPRPVEIKHINGNFILTEDVKIFFKEGLEETAEIAAGQLELTSEPNTGRHRRGIFLTIASALHREGYKLKTGRKRIDISGGSDAGVYYAIQTLRQLSATANAPGHIQGVEILDWPRFGWRGLMLDCSRTFQSLDYIRNTIDREPELVDRQRFPRLLSIAERGWSPAEVQDRDDFMSRLEKHLPLLEKMDITYYREQK